MRSSTLACLQQVPPISANSTNTLLLLVLGIFAQHQPGPQGGPFCHFVKHLPNPTGRQYAEVLEQRFPRPWLPQTEVALHTESPGDRNTGFGNVSLPTGNCFAKDEWTLQRESKACADPRMERLVRRRPGRLLSTATRVRSATVGVSAWAVAHPISARMLGACAIGPRAGRAQRPKASG